MADTLLLRIRAEALTANFERFRKNLLAAPSRLDALQRLDRSLEAIGTELKSVQQNVEDIGTADPAKVDVPGKADEVVQTLITLKRKVALARAEATNLQKACFHVNGTPVADSLALALRTSTDPLLLEIDAVTRGSAAVEADIPDLWRRLHETIEGEVPILSDFVELMGGVALRDSRFDDGISELTDELLRAYIAAGGKADFVAIPMRDQALLKTFAQIVRVTFPDWTLWSLPNAALEFWRSIEAPRIRGPLERHIGTMAPARAALIEKRDHDCLGDGYAVFTMGPAYAYCAVTLMLNPTLEADHRRVRAILAMLQCMDDKEGAVLQPYKPTRAQLLAAWNAARQQLDKPPLTLDLDNPALADIGDPDGAGTRVLMETFAHVLSRLTSPGFVADVWNEIQAWVEPLLDGDVSKARVDIPKGAELRHVFNAAWIARTHPNRRPGVDLTETVRQLRDRVRAEGK